MEKKEKRIKILNKESKICTHLFKFLMFRIPCNIDRMQTYYHL